MPTRPVLIIATQFYWKDTVNKMQCSVFKMLSKEVREVRPLSGSLRSSGFFSYNLVVIVFLVIERIQKTLLSVRYKSMVILVYIYKVFLWILLPVNWFFTSSIDRHCFFGSKLRTPWFIQGLAAIHKLTTKFWRVNTSVTMTHLFAMWAGYMYKYKFRFILQCISLHVTNIIYHHSSSLCWTLLLLSSIIIHRIAVDN